MIERCLICNKFVKHDKVTDCPAWEDAKAITIARLEAMPPNIRISIGGKTND